MFSYQHEYHAGNHADLIKHLTLTLILESLCKKDKPFTVIDCHAASGVYNLNDEKLLKTKEAKEGIEKLIRYYNDINIPMPEGLKNFLSIEDLYIKENKYAGSPEIERIFMEKKDCLHLIEKHPLAIENLKRNSKEKTLTKYKKNSEDVKIIIHEEDSYKCLNSLCPPLVKRGLVLCDPSYEDTSDYKSVTESLINVRKKWNTAIIAVWYPLLTRRKNETAQMLTKLEDACKLGTNPVESFSVELLVKNPDDIPNDSKSHLYGSGIFVMNPPWKLKENLEENVNFIDKLLKL